MAAEFHDVFDPRKAHLPTAFDQETASFRAGFKAEELVEFLYGAANNNEETFSDLVEKLHQSIDEAQAKILAKDKQVAEPLVEQVDALVDLLYFTYGSFALMGVEPTKIFEIVHQANMGKRFPDGKPHYHPVTNKVMKPADWEEKCAPEPKIKAELLQQLQKKQKKRM